MKKIFLIFLLIFNFIETYSQTKEIKTQDWNIATSDTKIQNVKYSKIIFQDLRSYKEDFGFVQKKLLNNIYLISPKISLEEQFKNAFNQIAVPSPNADKELIIQLRNFYLSEYYLSTMNQEIGKFNIKVLIFSGKDGQYQALKPINENIEIMSKVDVTNDLLKKSSEKVLDVIKASLLEDRYFSNQNFTKSDLNNSEKILKFLLPAYNSSVLKDGVYKNYDNFSSQNSVFELKKFNDYNSYLTSVSYSDSGKTKSGRNCFAVVKNGTPYFNAGDYFIKGSKKMNDFYFYAYLPKLLPEMKSDSKGILTPILSNFISGVNTEAISTNFNSLYEFKMDFQDGSFTPTKQMIFEKK